MTDAKCRGYENSAGPDLPMHTSAQSRHSLDSWHEGIHAWQTRIFIYCTLFLWYKGSQFWRKNAHITGKIFDSMHVRNASANLQPMCLRRLCNVFVFQDAMRTSNVLHRLSVRTDRYKWSQWRFWSYCAHVWRYGFCRCCSNKIYSQIYLFTLQTKINHIPLKQGNLTLKYRYFVWVK